MLVLTRKCRESIAVGDNSFPEHLLKVTVLDVAENKVRLGFEAHTDVPVYRWEVWQRACGNDRSGKEPPARKKATSK